MKWTDGPRACSLTDGGGLILVAQITLDDNGKWNAYNFPETSGEVMNGAFARGEIASGGYSTLAESKRVAEAVARRPGLPRPQVTVQ